jgi:RHS repeat-associated protein
VLQAGYVYDGANDRLQQIDYTGATPITTTYTNDVFGLTQVLVADDGTTQVYNLFGLDLISRDSGSEVRTLLVDGLGSVRTEMVGSVVETATTYTPYGEVLEQVGASGTVYGFTGEQEDGATGLLYLRARYYDSELKVFQSRDRWAGSAFRPETFHPYSYVGGHVVTLSDPSGHCYPPLEGLRGIEPTNCSNLDMAIRIARHPAATFGQKSFAYGYITSWTGSHLGLVAGAGILGGHAAAGVVNWGGAYLATHQTAATLTTAAAATAGAADEAAVVYGAATGDPLAQQEAILAQQLAMADGHLPFADLGAGARFFGRRATSGLDNALRFLDDCFNLHFFGGGGGSSSGGPSGLASLIERAKRAQSLVGDTRDLISPYTKREYALATTADGSITTHSGSDKQTAPGGFGRGINAANQLADRVGFRFRHYGFATHAEAKMIGLKPGEPVGVSRPMWPDCRNFFDHLAKSSGQPYVVADPESVWVFPPNKPAFAIKR